MNSAAVRLAMTVGLDNVVAADRDLGLDAPLTKVPSMTLGTNEVNLLDLTGAFASIRAGRMKLEPWGIVAFGAEGSGMRSLGAPTRQEQDLARRAEMTHLLQAVVEHGTGRGAALSNDIAAGKTGTSQDHRDAWFVGFNSDLIVGVWVGNDDRAPMKGVTGGSLPLEIWKRFVEGVGPILTTTSRLELTRESATPSPVLGNEQTQCDQAACAAAYRSFRPSDCTYQSYGGARKLCLKHLDHEVRGVEPSFQVERRRNALIERSVRKELEPSRDDEMPSRRDPAARSSSVAPFPWGMPGGSWRRAPGDDSDRP